MVEIFRDMDSVTVGLFQSILEAEGIATFVRNQALSSTEVTIPAFYPALCVMREEDVERAKELIKVAQGAKQGVDHGAVEQDWVCSSCQESNPGSFEVCWNCELVVASPQE